MKMPCDVYVYDDTSTTVHPPSFDVYATNQKTSVILSRASSVMVGMQAVAALPFPRGRFPYSIFVDDPTARFAPVSMGDLNGDQPQRLNVVVYPLPTLPASAPPLVGGGRFGESLNDPNGPTDPHALISSQTQWSANEKRGVRRLLQCYEASIDVDTADFLKLRDRWLRQLNELGILLSGQKRLQAARATQGEAAY